VKVGVECVDERVSVGQVILGAKCRESTMKSYRRRLEFVLAITPFPSGVGRHFGSGKDNGLKIDTELGVGGHLSLKVFGANIRLRVRWLSPLAPALTIFALPRDTRGSHSEGWEPENVPRLW